MKVWVDWDMHEVLSKEKYEERMEKLREKIKEDLTTPASDLDFYDWLDDNYTASALYDWLVAGKQQKVLEEYKKFIDEEVERELQHQTNITCEELQS